jgi:hypothetical protein
LSLNHPRRKRNSMRAVDFKADKNQPAIWRE